MAPMTPDDVADLANVLFVEDPSLLMFNALVETATGQLDEELLEGDETTEPENRPDAIAVVGRKGNALMFGMYCIGEAVPVDEARRHLTEAAAMLGPVEELNHLAAIPMVLQRARTMAAMTVHVEADGARRLSFYRNPVVDEAQARAFFVHFFGELISEMGQEADPDPTGPTDGGTGTVN